MPQNAISPQRQRVLVLADTLAKRTVLEFNPNRFGDVKSVDEGSEAESDAADVNAHQVVQTDLVVLDNEFDDAHELVTKNKIRYKIQIWSTHLISKHDVIMLLLYLLTSQFLEYSEEAKRISGKSKKITVAKWLTLQYASSSWDTISGSALHQGRLSLHPVFAHHLTWGAEWLHWRIWRRVRQGA
jgi:hypothetical protein